jgi:hypothetical protein
MCLLLVCILILVHFYTTLSSSTYFLTFLLLLWFFSIFSFSSTAYFFWVILFSSISGFLSSSWLRFPISFLLLCLLFCSLPSSLSLSSPSQPLIFLLSSVPYFHHFPFVLTPSALFTETIRWWRQHQGFLIYVRGSTMTWYQGLRRCELPGPSMSHPLAKTECVLPNINVRGIAVHIVYVKLL